MNFNRIDWESAQELLFKLSQALTPTPQTASPEDRKSSLFAQRLFVPRAEAPEKFPYPAKLMPILQEAKTQITIWTLEPEKKEPAQARVTPKAVSAPTVEKPVALKTPVAVEAEQKAPVILQAKKLIDQVRIAIQSLSTSVYLENPEPRSWKVAMTKLKPLVDELIVAISQTELDAHQEGSFTPFPKPASKEAPLPKSEKAIPQTFYKESAPTRSAPSQDKPPVFKPAIRTYEVSRGGEKVEIKEEGEEKLPVKKIAPPESYPKKSEPAPQMKAPLTLSSQPVHVPMPPLPEQERKAAPKGAQDKASPVSATYYPGTLPFQARFSKKKRKSPFHRPDRGEDEPTDSSNR